jgi:VWFA-related protein
MRTRPAVVLYIVLAIATLAAQSDQVPQPTFRTGANYVRVDMYALQDGQPVQDLRRDEVEVLEDGVVQTVEAFEHVVVRPATTQAAAPVEPDGVRASREAAADSRARVFVIFLDTYHTQLEGSANVRRPLVRFLERVLGPDDLVALMTPEMSARDITLSRKTTILSNILSEEWWGRRARIADEDPKETLYRLCGSRMNLPRAVTEEIIARRREKLTLDALEDLMTHLDGLREERKAVVVVTEGWMLYRPNEKLAAPGQGGPAAPPAFRPPVAPPADRGALNQPTLIECEADRNALAQVDHDRRLREVTEDANRGNVTFYPVFARGLVAFDAPISGDVPIQQDLANLRTRQDSLRALAVDTDGEALINTNNIEGGLRRIADDLSSYYLLGYYSSNSKLDGRFRSITVRVKRPGVRVRARRGYRGRTAEELISTAAGAPDPSRDALNQALNRVAGLNARSMFRIRPAAWARGDGSSVAGAVWVVGELDYRTRKELAWTAGAEAEVTVVGVDGSQVLAKTVTLPSGAGTFAIQIPENGTLGPGDYAVNVRLRPESGSDLVLTDTMRVTVPDRASPVGEAVIWRRGPSTGPQYQRTADLRFQRSERLRLEFATSAETAAGVAARMLDRAGNRMQVPVPVTLRTDAESGIRWLVADAALAPLAPGDYAIEVTFADSTQVTGFRVVP